MTETYNYNSILNPFNPLRPPTDIESAEKTALPSSQPAQNNNTENIDDGGEERAAENANPISNQNDDNNNSTQASEEDVNCPLCRTDVSEVQPTLLGPHHCLFSASPSMFILVFRFYGGVG